MRKHLTGSVRTERNRVINLCISLTNPVSVTLAPDLLVEAESYAGSSSQTLSQFIKPSLSSRTTLDGRVLECANTGRADYIVSGDRHLLKLGSYEGIEILIIREFLDLLAQKH